MGDFRFVVVGMGIQGPKRVRTAGSDVIATVDPEKKSAQFRHIQDVPLDTFSAAAVCTPDNAKLGILHYLLSNGKHVLVEKPLLGAFPGELEQLNALAKANGVVLYTGYNHRFEPHFIRMRDIIASKELGAIYYARLFYGNGTARDVRNSVWRDNGTGVLSDLGSHLIDTLSFWFGEQRDDFEVKMACRHENKAFDHVSVMSKRAPVFELEMSLLSWRNSFTADVIGSKGSAHINSLCKWGGAKFNRRWRILPSGRPREQTNNIESGDDPTWAAEYKYFKHLCSKGGKGSIEKDIWLERQLCCLGEQAEALWSKGSVK